MARIDIVDEKSSLDSPVLVEGFPGVGLVGKMAVDHLIATFEMDHYANVYCDSLPPVATYQEDTRGLVTPVRLYVDTERDLLALQSDVPIGPDAATEFGNCVRDWFDDGELLPVYISGLPRQTEAPPALYGVATDDTAGDRLTDAGVDQPAEMGLISGPTGALLAHATEHDTTAVGLVVESNPQLPDPIASQVVIDGGIEPIADIEVPTEDLSARAEEIEQARQQLIQRMQQATDDSSRAQPLRMYQ
ncbi:proteasome assembly chaperone family protein [Halohasta salina]|uniref:proteasome assembly chaperone family protein n=1 Tax=Halohasta salina TaxID=2961621 RepID=UPI0020A35ADD|nr:PAC2 family protein [Halohasta salina]